LDLISTSKTIIKEFDMVLYPDDFTEDKSETTVLQTFLTDNKLGQLVESDCQLVEPFVIASLADRNVKS
jgi:hypothetical protein